MLTPHLCRARPRSCVGLTLLEPEAGSRRLSLYEVGGVHLSPVCVATHPEFQEPRPPLMKVEKRMGTAPLTPDHGPPRSSGL